MSAIGQQKEVPAISKARSQQVLAYCERSFVEQIGVGFNSQLDGVLEHIKSVSSQALSYQEKQLYSELHHTMLLKRHEMGVEFKIFLQKYFKEKIFSQFAEKKTTLQELSIVSDDQEEQFIMERRLEKQISDSLGDELNSLALRIEYLLGEEKNPFSPEVLAKALTSTFEKIIANNKLQKQAINIFAQAWPHQVKSTYQGINSYLVANDVIPDIKSFQIKKEQIKQANDSSMPPANTVESKPISPSIATPIAPPLNSSKSFDLPDLNTFLSNFGKNDFPKQITPNVQPSLSIDSLNIGLDALAPVEKTQTLTPTFSETNSHQDSKVHQNSSQENAIANFYKLLAEVNKKLDDSSSVHLPAHLRKPTILPSDELSGLNKPIDKSVMLTNQQIMKSVNDLQQQFLQLSMAQALAPAMSSAFSSPIISHRNVITELAESQKNSQFLASGQVQVDANEQLIIDLLGLMFDKIFSHPKLPEHIKYLIGKLQIPILKASLLDKTFFIYKDNPVRLFLDCLATTSTLYNTEYHSKFEEIINHILLQEDITQRTFTKALEQIQTMLQDYENKENKFIENISPALENDERSESYYEQVLQFVSKSSSRAHYLPVRSFMEKVWAKSFAKKWTPLINGTNVEFMKVLPLEAKVNLHQSMLVFDMMIWSTNLKEKNDAIVDKLKSFVPKIADGLKKVCTELNISAEDFNNLSYLLAQRHIAMMRSEKPVDFENHLEEIKKDETRVLKTFDAKIEQTQQIKVASKEITNTKSDFYNVFLKGNWFEFTNDKTKMRLIWVSPQKTIFLFNNPENKKVYRFDKSKVWAYFKSKHLAPISLKEVAFNSEVVIADTVESFKNRVLH